MSSPSRSRRIFIVIALLLLLLLLALLARCSRAKPPSVSAEPANAPEVVPPAAPGPGSSVSSKAMEDVPEKLTPATVKAPAHVLAGAMFVVEWTGPNNPQDYVTIVPLSAPAASYDNYAATAAGPKLELTAPVAAGNYEVRYVTVRSRTILGRAPISVDAAQATVSAPREAVMGSVVSIAWTGPNNPGDFITLVPKTLKEGQYANYTYTNKGSPLQVTAPVEAGEAEVRYMTGQGNTVLSRAPITLVAPVVKLSADAEIVAGGVLNVAWEGPRNEGDYITVVPKTAADGHYENAGYVARGSPVKVQVPIDSGEAEIRYMTGQGNKVLGRRPVTLTAPQVTLAAPAEVVAGSEVEISWTGPKNGGDYITLVPRALKDGQYGNNSQTSAGSPLKVLAPMEAGDAEIRYMSGSGARVWGRRGIQIVDAKITFDAPTSVKTGQMVEIGWSGPGNGGDYIAIVAKDAPDAQADHYAVLGRASTVKVESPKIPGLAEIRYVSGQGRKVLARRPIEVTAP